MPEPEKRPNILVPLASPAWRLLLQSGVVLKCLTGIPLSLLLREEFGLSAGQLALVETYLLDGLPVDDPEDTPVYDGSRLALAAGLPGITGLAMKSGSAVRGLRAGIAPVKHEQSGPAEGRIILSLYSLVLPALAGHFLERGLEVEPAQLLRYARFAPADRCLVDGKEVVAEELQSALRSMPAETLIKFKAILCQN